MLVDHHACDAAVKDDEMRLVAAAALFAQNPSACPYVAATNESKSKSLMATTFCLRVHTNRRDTEGGWYTLYRPRARAAVVYSTQQRCYFKKNI